jgi:hypothetical protein
MTVQLERTLLGTEVSMSLGHLAKFEQENLDPPSNFAGKPGLNTYKSG